MEHAIETLKKLKDNIERILEINNNSKLNNKEILDKVVNISGEFVSLLTNIDKDTLEDWKTNDKTLFLRFVPGLKNILTPLSSYINTIEPLLKSFYTSEIAEEINILNLEILKFEKELSPDNESIIEEKDKLERKYNQLQLLLKEKDELVIKHNMLKLFNIEELYLEISKLDEEITEMKDKIEPLKKEKAELELFIKEYSRLNNDIEHLKSTEENELASLLDKVDDTLLIIREQHKNWDEDRERFLKRLEHEAANLKSTEEEIKSYLSNLSVYREAYLRNKEIIEKHFLTDKKIVDSIPNMKYSIEEKIKTLEIELNNLDKEIKSFIEINQKITDEMTKNPLTFEH